MPGDRDVHIVKRAGANHEPLGRAALLCRTSVVAHPALHVIGGQPILHRRRRQQRAGAEQIMPARMSHAVPRQWSRLRHAGFLAEAGQRIILAENGDHRPTLAGLTHHGCGNTRQILGDAKTLLAQRGDVLGHGIVFVVGDLGPIPNAIAQGLEQILFVVHQLPDLLGVLHRTLRWFPGGSLPGLGPEGKRGSKAGLPSHPYLRKTVSRRGSHNFAPPVMPASLETTWTLGGSSKSMRVALPPPI
jgi:hypothetical protein